jgi:hypothetical protein
MGTLENKIPTHDPQTGELNPYYEELTGEKNPLSSEVEDVTPVFDLKSLIGKKFKYQSKYGLSDWTDTVKDIEVIHGIETNLQLPVKRLKDGEEKKPFEIYGYKYHLQVRSTRGNQLYDFNDCIFLLD